MSRPKFHPPATPGRALVDVYIGGGFQCVPRFGDPTNADANWVIDTSSELLAVSEFRGDSFFTSAVGSGETSRTLAEGSPTAVRRALQDVANMDAEEGLGQARGLGARAMQQLLASDEFDRQVELLRDELLKKHNGNIQSIRIRVFAGTAGGTGTPGSIQFAEDLARRLRDMLHISIIVDFLFIGGVTAIGNGRRVAKSAAASIADALAYATDPSCPPTEIRRVSFVEFPPVGNDRALRETFVRQFVQALRAEEIEKLFQIKDPNGALNSWIGNVRLYQADFYQSLDPVTEVAPQIASDWSREVHQLVTGTPPQTSQVAEINLDVTRDMLERESTEEIVDRANDSDQDEVTSAILLPACTATAAVSAVLRKSGRIDLNNVPATFAAAPTSLTVTRHRLRMLRSLSAAFDQEVTDLAQRGTEQESAVASHLQEVIDALDSLRSPSVWTRLTSNTVSRLMNLENSAIALRRCHDELGELRVQLEVVRTTATSLKTELSFLCGQLERILAILASYSSTMQRSDSQRLVTSVPIDAVFNQVWNLSSQSPVRRLAAVTSGVEKVTIAGLAASTGADQARLDNIAERIVLGTPTFVGPPTGGLTNPQRATRVTVLPPVDANVAVQVETLIKKIDSNNVVAFAPSACAGVNVLRIRVFEVDSLEDVFSGFMRQSLKAAWNDTHRGLFFPKDSVQALGIRIEDEVVFGTRRNGAVHHAK
jgi:hypothetical protein